MSPQYPSGQSKSTALTESRQRLRAIANHLPQRPGVYIMKDAHGTIIYVGKAVNLRRRVGSYAAPSAMKDGKVAKLVGSIKSLSFVEVSSELEALLIESRLIKAHIPTFNRQLIDPESCCFLRLDPREGLPRIEVVRFRRDDDAEYLGPFWHSAFVRDAAEAVTNAFRLRRCSGKPAPGKAPCMYSELGKCSGPCSGEASGQAYRRSVLIAWDSLAGKSDEASRRLTTRRDRLSDQLRFEDARTVHLQIRALEHVSSSVPDPCMLDGDFAVVVPSYLRGRPVVLMFGDGRLLNTSLSGPRSYPDTTMIAERLVRMCKPSPDLLPGRPTRDDLLIIHSYLNRRAAKGILVPLHSHKSVAALADSILSAITEVRRG